MRADFFVLQARRGTCFSYPRVGVTASKKVGNAVVRNRCKRRLRALADLFVPWSIPGIDYVFIARSSMCDTSWDDLVRAVRVSVPELFKRMSR